MRTISIVVACAAMLVASSAYATTVTFSDPGNSGTQAYQQGFGTVDLTTGLDVVVSFTIDLSGVTANDVWSGPYAMIGLRDVGQNVALPASAHGGWMVAFAPDFVNTNPNSLDIDDKFNLNTYRGGSELAYDATDPDTIVAPFGTQDTKGFWGDRDGVDAWQDDSMANTGGVYDMGIRYHRVNATQGTMFATINGVTQGFDTTTGDGFNIDTDPAGLSFTADDFSNLELFAGAEFHDGGAGTIVISDLQANTVPEPVSMIFFGTGLVGVAGLVTRRRMRKAA